MPMISLIFRSLLYRVHYYLAPKGSFPWALYQVNKKGGFARRESWQASYFIHFDRPWYKYVTLTSALGSKAWQPYWEDFLALDWVVYPECKKEKP